MNLTEEQRKNLKPFVKRIAIKNNTTDRNVRYVLCGRTKVKSELSKKIVLDVINVLKNLQNINV